MRRLARTTLERCSLCGAKASLKVWTRFNEPYTTVHVDSDQSEPECKHGYHQKYDMSVFAWNTIHTNLRSYVDRYLHRCL